MPKTKPRSGQLQPPKTTEPVAQKPEAEKAPQDALTESAIASESFFGPDVDASPQAVDVDAPIVGEEVAASREEAPPEAAAAPATTERRKPAGQAASPATAPLSPAMQKLQNALNNPPDAHRSKTYADGINVIAERRVQGKDAPHLVLDRLAAVTKALGAQNWYDVRSFDWCLDRIGNRHRFSRYYPSVAVLVDVFDDASVTVRAEVESKTAAIIAQNELREKQGHMPLGYLPIVRGAIIPDGDFEAALRGEQVEIREAVPA